MEVIKINGCILEAQIENIETVNNYKIVVIKDRAGFSVLRILGQNLISSVYIKTSKIIDAYKAADTVKTEITKEQQRMLNFK